MSDASRSFPRGPWPWLALIAAAVLPYVHTFVFWLHQLRRQHFGRRLTADRKLSWSTLPGFFKPDIYDSLLEYRDCLAGLRTDRGVQPIRERRHLAACSSPTVRRPRYRHSVRRRRGRECALNRRCRSTTLLRQVLARESFDLVLQLGSRVGGGYYFDDWRCERDERVLHCVLDSTPLDVGEEAGARHRGSGGCDHLGQWTTARLDHAGGWA